MRAALVAAFVGCSSSSCPRLVIVVLGSSTGCSRMQQHCIKAMRQPGEIEAYQVRRHRKINAISLTSLCGSQRKCVIRAGPLDLHMTLKLMTGFITQLEKKSLSPCPTGLLAARTGSTCPPKSVASASSGRGPAPQYCGSCLARLTGWQGCPLSTLPRTLVYTLHYHGRAQEP